MVTLKNFKFALESILNLKANYEKLRDSGIDILESQLMDIPNIIFNVWLESNFTDKGIELIYWWLYEDVDKIVTVDDIFGKHELDISNIENFYQYLANDIFML